MQCLSYTHKKDVTLPNLPHILHNQSTIQPQTSVNVESVTKYRGMTLIVFVIYFCSLDAKKLMKILVCDLHSAVVLADMVADKIFGRVH